MLIKKLIIGLLSFYIFDVNQVSRKPELNPFSEMTVERELETRKKKEVKKTKKCDKRKWKKKKYYRERTFKIVGTRSKDARYSNQKSLRRMFRNG